MGCYDSAMLTFSLFPQSASPVITSRSGSLNVEGIPQARGWLALPAAEHIKISSQRFLEPLFITLVNTPTSPVKLDGDRRPAAGDTVTGVQEDAVRVGVAPCLLRLSVVDEHPRLDEAG